MIFQGNITKWDDSRIRELNPKAKLPAEAIRLVVREDASAQTALLASYLERSYPGGWLLGSGELPPWAAAPNAIRANGSAEMVASLSSQSYAIGYTECWSGNNYTRVVKGANLAHGYSEVALRNARGNFVDSGSADWHSVSFPWPQPDAAHPAYQRWPEVKFDQLQDSDVHPLGYIAHAQASGDLSGNGTVGAAVKQMIGYWLSEEVQGKMQKQFYAHPLPQKLLLAAIQNWASIKAPSEPLVGWVQPDLAKYQATATARRRLSLRRLLR